MNRRPQSKIARTRARGARAGDDRHSVRIGPAAGVAIAREGRIEIDAPTHALVLMPALTTARQGLKRETRNIRQMAAAAASCGDERRVLALAVSKMKHQSFLSHLASLMLNMLIARGGLIKL